MATKGHSTKLEFGDAATVAGSTTWTPVAKITEITPPNAIEAEDIDTSHMESPDQFNEYEPGWAEGGEVELTIQYDKEQNEDVYALFRVPKAYRITFVDGSKWHLNNSYVKAFGNEVERKGIVTAKITIKISGKPEFVKAA